MRSYQTVATVKTKNWKKITIQTVKQL